MANDLTILFITASQMPPRWVAFHREHLLAAAYPAPIICVSRKPVAGFDGNLLDEAPKSYWNIYMQMLRAAMQATTPYVAMAEDDVLYTPQHFWDFRPPLDTVAYDHSRWSLFAWEKEPIYCLRQRLSNCSLVAPRQLLIEALAERQAKWPDGAPDTLVGEVGREKVDRRLRVTPRKCVEFWSRGPIVMLNHRTGTDTGDYGRDPRSGKHMVKAHGQIQAIEIPHWGRAAEIAAIYNNP